MLYSRHRLTASVAYVIMHTYAATNQLMTSRLALLAYFQFVKNWTVSVQFSNVALCAFLITFANSKVMSLTSFIYLFICYFVNKISEKLKTDLA